MIILFVIHLIVALFLVAVILLQKKEGGIGGLGGGGGSGGLGGLMSGRAKADGLSKATGLLAVAFFATSLALAVIGSHSRTSGPLVPGTTAPATAPVEGTAPANGTGTGGAAPAETAPAQPATPAVPAGN